MKSTLILKPLLFITLIAVTGISLKSFYDNQTKKANRADLCRKAKPLTQSRVKDFDRNGVKERGGTFYRQVSFKSKPIVSVVIFPQALDAETWFKVPPTKIKYIGKRGDGKSLGQWFSPDHFYLVEVPDNTTALAFSRLCHQNSDVKVYSIRKWEQTGNNKISINNKISLEHATPLPKINPAHILVNAGSNKEDSLKDGTGVYFRTKNFRIPQK